MRNSTDSDSGELVISQKHQHNSTTNTCSHMHQRRNGSSNSIKSGNSSNSMYGNNRGGTNNYNYNRLENGGMSAAETNANILEQQVSF